MTDKIGVHEIEILDEEDREIEVRIDITYLPRDPKDPDDGPSYDILSAVNLDTGEPVELTEEQGCRAFDAVMVAE